MKRLLVLTALLLLAPSILYEENFPLCLMVGNTFIVSGRANCSFTLTWTEAVQK